MTILTKHRRYQELPVNGVNGSDVFHVEAVGGIVEVTCSHKEWNGLPPMTLEVAEQVRSMLDWAIMEATKPEPLAVDPLPAGSPLPDLVRRAREGGAA